METIFSTPWDKFKGPDQRRDLISGSEVLLMLIQKLLFGTYPSFTVYRSVWISRGWSREASLYTEGFGFQGVGIEEFHCIQRDLDFRGLE